MSRIMQIDIRIIPFYEGRFDKQFPRLADMFGQVSHTDPLKKERSLYDLVDHLVSVNRDPAVPDDLKAKIGAHVETLLSLKREARDHLLARRLDDLDQVLYKLEDRFDELEASL
ncbi:MAG: hypothetical protein JRF65_12405 [Deltaproteobacteria bacterium]|nr:hypothetical protein [Deltaproteobacteria bacterium]